MLRIHTTQHLPQSRVRRPSSHDTTLSQLAQGLQPSAKIAHVLTPRRLNRLSAPCVKENSDRRRAASLSQDGGSRHDAVFNPQSGTSPQSPPSPPFSTLGRSRSRSHSLLPQSRAPRMCDTCRVCSQFLPRRTLLECDREASRWTLPRAVVRLKTSHWHAMEARSEARLNGPGMKSWRLHGCSPRRGPPLIETRSLRNATQAHLKDFLQNFAV